MLDVSVYGFGSRNDIVPPFSNNTMMKEITHIWGTDGENLKVEYLGVRPTNFKYVFAEIETREGSQFIFLHKPVSQSFTIQVMVKVLLDLNYMDIILILIMLI